MPEQADDRRTKRTRKAVLDAFFVLLQQQRYAQIRVADVIARADVGRSTFYDHFKNKDDLLLHSMSWIYAILADVVVEDADTAKLAGLLDHFWGNRKLARELMSGPAAALGPKHGIRHLTALIETRLAVICREQKRTPVVPLPLAAAQITEGMMSLIKAWLLGAASSKPAILAKVVHESARGSMAAFLGPASK